MFFLKWTFFGKIRTNELGGDTVWAFAYQAQKAHPGNLDGAEGFFVEKQLMAGSRCLGFD